MDVYLRLTDTNCNPDGSLKNIFSINNKEKECTNKGYVWKDNQCYYVEPDGSIEPIVENNASNNKINERISCCTNSGYIWKDDDCYPIGPDGHIMTEKANYWDNEHNTCKD